MMADSRIDTDIAMIRLRQKGFIEINESNFSHLIQHHPRVVVFLQSDVNRHSEVADSWVIVPEVINHFPANTFTPTVADIPFSEMLSARFKVLKFPAVLFFQGPHFCGAVSGLQDWQSYLVAFEAQRKNAIPAGLIDINHL